MVYVITAVHDRCDITKKFIDCLNNQTYKNIHLLLVDDGSTDGTAEMVRKTFLNSTVIYGDGNLWWGGALDKAYKWIKQNHSNVDDAVLLSNDDVYYADDYVSKGIELLEKVGCGMVLGKGYSRETGELADTVMNVDYSNDWRIGPFSRSEDNNGDCSSTRSLFMKISTFIDVGGFHPVLLPHYGSDYEWTIRAARKGHTIYAFDELKYEFTTQSTGYKDKKKQSIKQLLSKKSVSNPFYRLTFIMLSTPVKYVFRELFYQIRRWGCKVKDA